MTITPMAPATYRVRPCNDIFKTQENIVKANSLIQKCYRIAYAILSVIIFPIGLNRLIVYVIRKIAPSKILPGLKQYNLAENQAQFKKKPSEKLLDKIQYLQHLHDFRDKFVANTSNHAQLVTLETADSIKIDACSIISPSQLKTPAAEQKWIIYFHGNKSCYEGQLNELKLIATKTRANVLTANYRGIMRSEAPPTSTHDLILDGEAQVQYLLSLGVEKKNILLHGWSLGAAVATEVASNHQVKGHEINLCHERSFTNLVELFKTRLPDILGHTIKNILGFIAGKYLHAAGWHFDGIKSFQKINGYKWIIYSREDGFVKYPASLYKGLKEAMMTDEDRKIKRQRVKAYKSTGIRTPRNYDEFYKPKFTHRLAYGKKENRDYVIKKEGLIIHCRPISATKDVFDHYLLQARDALKIKPLTYFQTFRSYLFNS